MSESFLDTFSHPTVTQIVIYPCCCLQDKPFRMLTSLLSGWLSFKEQCNPPAPPRPCTVYQDKKELRVGNYISIKFCSGPGMFCKRKESDTRKHCALFLLLLLLLRENVGSGHHFCYLLQVRVTKLHRNTQRTPTCIKNVKMLKDYCLPIIDIYIPYIWWHCKWILKLIFWSLNLVNEHIHIGFIKRSIVWPIKETSPNVFWNAIFSFSKEHYTARINILS